MKNITNYTVSHGTGIPEGGRIVFATIAMFLLICGSLGNIMLLVVLCVNRSTWKPCNIFIGHLAFCSLPVLFSSLPFVIMDLIADRNPEVSSLHCQPLVSVFNAGYATCVYTLTAIAFSRYIMICRNHLYHTFFSFKTTFSACVALWLLALVISVPNYSCKSDSVHNYVPHCGFRTKSEVLDYSIGIFCLNLVLSTFIIAIFYAAIFYRMQQSFQKCMSYKKVGKDVRQCSVFTKYPLQDSGYNFPSTSKQVSCPTESGTTGAVKHSFTFHHNSRSSASDTVCTIPAPKPMAVDDRMLRRRSSSLPDLPRVLQAGKGMPSFTRVLQVLAWTSREKIFMKKLLIVSVTNFVVCMPYVFAVLVNFVTPLVCEILVFAHMLLLVNPSLSWLIYGTMNRNIYKAYKESFRKLVFRGRRITNQQMVPRQRQKSAL